MITRNDAAQAIRHWASGITITKFEQAGENEATAHLADSHGNEFIYDLWRSSLTDHVLFCERHHHDTPIRPRSQKAPAGAAENA